jgi:hypothetical protein
MYKRASIDLKLAVFNHERVQCIIKQDIDYLIKNSTLNILFTAISVSVLN